MLNTFNYNINAVSGTMRKSHPKSRMVVRNLSNHPCEFDSHNPRVYDSVDRAYKDIVVLQTMLCGDNRVLIEFVETKYFEEA